MFRQQQRLTRSAQTEFFHQARQYASGGVKLYFIPDQELKVAVRVRKTTASAVERNTWKRRVIAWLKTQDLKGQYFILLSPNSLTFESVIEKISYLLRKTHE